MLGELVKAVLERALESELTASLASAAGHVADVDQARGQARVLVINLGQGDQGQRRGSGHIGSVAVATQVFVDQADRD